MANAFSTAKPSVMTEELIAARIERLPPSGWYARMMLIVGMAGFFDAFDALTIAFVVPALIGLWHLAPQDIGPKIGLLISIGYVGQLIGAVALSYIAETFGRLIVLFQAIFAFGVMATAFVSIWVVPHLGWQWMFVIGALPALLAIWLRRLVPESPRWLAHVARLAEADAALSKIEGSLVETGRTLPPLPAGIPPIMKEA